MPVGLAIDAASQYLMPLAQQAAQTVPSVLPSYHQTVQAVSPFLPLAAQPSHNSGNDNNNQQSYYNQAGQHFKAGALPWVGDSGASQANTGLWYLTQAMRNDQQFQEIWHSQELRQQEASLLRLQIVEKKLDALQNSNEALQRSLDAMADANRQHHHTKANNLNVIG
jgi:hypothetical protein